MKYQIYLNKDISELINAIAKAQKQKPATFIKEFMETSFKSVKEYYTEDDLKVIKNYGKSK